MPMLCRHASFLFEKVTLGWAALSKLADNDPFRQTHITMNPRWSLLQQRSDSLNRSHFFNPDGVYPARAPEPCAALVHCRYATGKCASSEKGSSVRSSLPPCLFRLMAARAR